MEHGGIKKNGVESPCGERASFGIVSKQSMAEGFKALAMAVESGVTASDEEVGCVEFLNLARTTETLKSRSKNTRHLDPVFEAMVMKRAVRRSNSEMNGCKLRPAAKKRTLLREQREGET